MDSKSRFTRLVLSKAIDGFLLACAASGYSPHTLSDYQNTLRQFLAFTGDRPVVEITADDVRAFLADLRKRGRAPKTIRNAHGALSSLWTWLRKEFGVPHIVRHVAVPKASLPTIEVFTEEEIRALLKACRYTTEANTIGRRRFTMRRPTALRDEAIVLVLLDTGLRASELCALNVGDVDLEAGRITVQRGKGGRGRVVFLGKVARRAVWRYLIERDEIQPTDPLFLSERGHRMSRFGLCRLLKRLGERAGVERCHPHKFRHTFATQFLRNGGDEMTLQKLLGHTSRDMLARYVHFVEADLAEVHRTVSPVDRWRL